MTNTPVTSKLFDFDHERNMFVQEISILSYHGVEITNDGFTMISDKTGNRVQFRLFREVVRHDGEVIHWVFLPTENDIERHSLPKNLSVRIIND